MRGAHTVLAATLLALSAVALAYFAYVFVFSVESSARSGAGGFVPMPAGDVTRILSMEGMLVVEFYFPVGVSSPPAVLYLGAPAGSAQPTFFRCDSHICEAAYPAYFPAGTYRLKFIWPDGAVSEASTFVEGVPYSSSMPWPLPWRLQDRRPVVPFVFHGANSFGDPLSTNTEYNTAVIADVDGDGVPEYVAGGSGGIGVYEGDVLSVSASDPVDYVAVAGGRVIGAGGSGVYVYEYTGDTLSRVCTIALSPDVVIPADVLGGGEPELLVVSDGNVYVYSLSCESVASFTGTDVVALDVDGDGKDEVFFERPDAVGLWDGHVVWTSSASPTGPPSISYVGGEPAFIYPEGSDVVYISPSGRVVRRDEFSVPVAYAVSSDLDGDGTYETIAVAPDRVMISGSMNVTISLPSSGPVSPPLVAVFGSPAIVVAQEGNVYLLPTSGTGDVFSLESSLGPPMPYPPLAYDLDGDDDLEVIVFFAGGTLVLDTVDQFSLPPIGGGGLIEG